ncbi:MAG TPA: hypothetical protein VGP33_07570, partial [Chloroflexota bacterium]|nr:hypothetical protein [Chloroflexota bacterium]
MPISETLCPARALTGGARQHFFGYYDKTPWDASGRYTLALSVDFIGRPPEPDDTALIGLVDVATGRLEPVAETRAWNWQQGTMLHWLPTAPDREIIFNDRVDGQLVSVILDVHSGQRRTLPAPIYAISHDGGLAITPNFARLARQRPGYGYAGVADPWEGVDEPEDDGIYLMNLTTGERRLALSIRQVAQVKRRPSMDGVVHWLNHLQFSPDDGRFVFLHRWRRSGGAWYTQMLTAAPEGADLRCVADDEMVSHFDWRDPTHLLAWARQPV